jgi:hypothetical protein
MTFLETLRDEALNVLPPSRHEAYRLAFAHSLGHDPLAGPADFEPYEFTQKELYDLRLLLLRPLAWEYVREVLPDLKQSAFNRRTHIDEYQRRFGRDPLLVSVKPRIMMLTYGEWRALAGG